MDSEVCDDKGQYGTWRKEQVVNSLSKKLFDQDEQFQQSIF